MSHKCFDVTCLQPPTHPLPQDAEEQAQLDLLHSVLAELRASQGRDLNEPLTPADMDEIEARVANLVQIDATTTSSSAAAADTETQAKAEAEHPRDHTVVAAVSPTVEAATPGAALKPATIVGGEKKVVAPKPVFTHSLSSPFSMMMCCAVM